MFRTRIALVVVASAAFAGLAGAGGTASAAPGDGRCVVDALVGARAEGLRPREAATQRGFRTVAGWLWNAYATCGDATEEPPGQ